MDGQVYRIKHNKGKSGKDYIWLVLHQIVKKDDKEFRKGYPCLLFDKAYEMAQELGLEEGEDITILGKVDIWRKRTDVGDEAKWEDEWRIIVEKVRKGLSE
jgi:hypothetical protein